MMAYSAANHCFVQTSSSMGASASLLRRQATGVEKHSTEFKPRVELTDSEDIVSWHHRAGFSIFLAAIAAFGSVTLPARADVTTEEKSRIEVKWKDNLRNLSNAREEAKRQAIQEQKVAIKSYSDMKRKAAADLASENSASLKKLADERKNILESAKTLKGRSKEDAEAMAIRNYNTGMAEFNKDKTRKENSMKAINEANVARFELIKAKAFSQAEEAYKAGMKQNEVEKQSALANMHE